MFGVTTGIQEPNLYQQGSAPNAVGAFLGSSQIYPIPFIDDLWVDTANHVVKRCISVNPYIWVSIEGSGGAPTPANKFHLVSAASNNAQVVKASPGTLYGWSIYNNAGYPIFVKVYDKASNPVVGADTPAQTFGVQAGTKDSEMFDNGITYANGIAIAIVKGIADNDNTAVAAGDCVVDLFFL